MKCNGIVEGAEFSGVPDNKAYGSLRCPGIYSLIRGVGRFDIILNHVNSARSQVESSVE